MSQIQGPTWEALRVDIEWDKKREWPGRHLRSLVRRIMTVFRHPNGVRYMQSFPPFREIRGPKG